MRHLSILLLLLLSLYGSALAQLNSNLKEEFQADDAHGIVIVSKASEIHAAINKIDTKILCLQTWEQSIPSESQLELLDWVRSGKTLWFYDVRLAPLFGMKGFLLGKDQFRSKPEKGVIGSSKHPGAATVGISFGNHAVQTAVGQVTVFLPELSAAKDDPVTYGAIEVAGDTVPLLRFTLDSPALMALRREGRGLIVFKTLLWTEPLSGERFQRNLLDYSAGFQVPGEAGMGKVGYPPGPEAEYIVGEPAIPLPSQGEASPQALLRTDTNTSTPTKLTKTDKLSHQVHDASWRLELKDGTSLTGAVESPLLLFETSSASYKLKPEEVTSIEFGSSIKLDKLTTRAGKSLSGIFMSSPLKFRTASGGKEYDKEDIQLLINEPSASEEK